MRTAMPWLLGILVAGCMSRFTRGPVPMPPPSTPAAIELGACTTPPALFDCAGRGALAVYLVDYLGLNGFATAAPGPGARAHVRVSEDRNAVAVELRLEAPRGTVFSAAAQGDTLLRALVRLELLLAERAGFERRILTSPDLRQVMERIGRKEVSATANGFVYR